MPESLNLTETDTVDISSPSYLEDPAIALIDIQINDMTDAQLEAMLAELNTLCNQPGAMRRRMGEESTAIKTKTPRASKKRVMDML